MAITDTFTPPFVRKKPKQTDQPASVPSIDEIIVAIQAECRQAGVKCNRDRAKAVIRMLERARDHVRKHDYVYHLSQNDLDRRHVVLDTIMADDTAAIAGSAHDLINRGLLDPARGELNFVHTKDGTAPLFYCGVTLDTQRSSS